MADQSPGLMRSGMRGAELGLAGGKASSDRSLAGVVVALLRLNDVTPFGIVMTTILLLLVADKVTPFSIVGITLWVVDKLLLLSWLISLDVSVVAGVE
jgi:hypothetical protein